jgi:hypothetical protein
MPKVALKDYGVPLETDVAPTFRVEQRRVTPLQAAQWLENCLPNRPMTRDRVESYAQSMRDGAWLLSGQPLLFNPEGRLMDGRQRLTACVESQCAFDTFIIWGIPDEAMAVIDTGRSRSGGDALAIARDVPNSRALAAALKWVYLFESDRVLWGGDRVTIGRPLLLKLYDEHPLLANSLPPARQAKRIVSMALGTALHYFFARKDQALADTFFEHLSHGSGNMDTRHSMYRLRQQLMKQWGAKEKMTNMLKAALLVKVWNDWRTGKYDRGRVQWRDDNPNEPFPTIQ